MKTLIVLSLLLAGCAHTQNETQKTLNMGGVSKCGPDDCGKPVAWETL